MSQANANGILAVKKADKIPSILIKDLKRNKYVYLMILPVIAYYLIFHYWPMYGATIAFKDYSLGKGINGSEWVGFKYFLEFFNSHYFYRVLNNTIMINLYQLAFGFPIPIIFAILLNEVTNRKFKVTVQTISYMPHFISTMVVAGLIIAFTARDGVINDILAENGLGVDYLPRGADIDRSGALSGRNHRWSGKIQKNIACDASGYSPNDYHITDSADRPNDECRL